MKCDGVAVRGGHAEDGMAVRGGHAEDGVAERGEHAEDRRKSDSRTYITMRFNPLPPAT